jgi:hypothetical protein
MTGMQSPDFTRYLVESGRNEMRKSLLGRVLAWVLITLACAVIVVFAYLIVSGGVL